MRKKGDFNSEADLCRRLESKIIPEPNSGCHLWLGTLTGTLDYGCIKVRGRTTVVHKVIWEKANGPVPERMEVCHSCDVPSCCNLDHLFLGTHEDNMRDMSKKGRAGRRGAKMPLDPEKRYREVTGAMTWLAGRVTMRG
jgi:hypothetical protein